MKVHVIGGGPAGLYFAILLKKAWPQTDVVIFERNRPDDTFGFGVVFSDQTLDTFETYDRDSYRAIVGHFAYWDDIEIHFRGTTHRIGGNGFCGCSRATLLKILGRRARSLGVRTEYQTEIDPNDPAILGADLVVAADGINSRMRETFADKFGPSVDLRPNLFSWMGSTRPFDAFTFFFRETEHGIFIAHCYQYEPGRSTWIIETDPATFARTGLDPLDEAASARFVEGIFAGELGGHRLITNRSIWRNFPTIRCERWTADNVVLIGDAKATAHFSIGSGTKLAMEDGIALYEAFRATADAPARSAPIRLRGEDVAPALAHFETRRRKEVEKTQHSADVSLVWFEHVKRFWSMHPTRFAFGLMTRSKAITYDNLALRAPEFVREADRLVAREAALPRLRDRHRATAGADVSTFSPARDDAREPCRSVADVPILIDRRRARRLASRALRIARDRRRRPDVHRDDRRLGGSAHLARLRRDVQRRPRGGVEAHRRFRARAVEDQVLHAARPCRAQRRDPVDVGRHRRAVGGGRLADHLGVTIALFPA